MESPPIPPGILHNHSHNHTHYSPLYHLPLTGLSSLRACTTRRLGATSGFSPLHPACLVSPLPPSSSATTFYRILTPSSPPSSTVLHIFSIRRQGLASLGENRVPPSRARPPRLRSLMPFTTKLTPTFLALALLALAHGHSTGTNQRASPPAPRRVFSS